MSKKGTWSYDWSWTQPYVAMNEFYINDSKEQKIQEELALLDSIDEKVQNQLTYPEAQRIIADIMMKRKPNND